MSVPAPTIPPAAAATRPTAARSSPPCTGSRPPTPSPPKSVSTTSSSQGRSRRLRRRRSFLDNLNPNSLEILTGAKLEPSLANARLEDRFQFERVGYFCLDPDSTAGNLVFNRTLPLKDSWAKIEKKAGG